ncbi:MAG: anthranilate synthase component I [Alphaproteobacteria bacterium]
MSGAAQQTPENFQAAFNAKKTQLVWRWRPADLETPVSAYLKLCGDAAYCFLLESVEGGSTLGRYSIIGLDPDLLWKCHGKNSLVKKDGGAWAEEKTDALTSLRALIKDSHIDDIPGGLPPMACSGLFGYLGYDMVRLAENIPGNNKDDIGLDDSVLMRPRTLAIFDNVKSMVCFVMPVYIHAGNSKDKAADVYKYHQQALDVLIGKLAGPVLATKSGTQLSLPLKVQSNMKPEDYKNAVRKVVDYTLQGEIFQAVLSQRFTVDFDLPAFELYRSLRRLNPSPFLFHVQFDDFALVGSSPEILVRVRGGRVTIRPIAGTRKSGKDSAEDKALAEDLLTDPKERAEHLMLLDLGRNDMGRVCEFGTIDVTDQFTIEHYSHVMHIVSNIEGTLRKDLDIIDAFFAGFPAGTVSGAPKVRAMEIIEELEVSRRGFYGGGIGYFSSQGVMDTCIALRTALVKGGKIHVQAGAGVVADSKPESEYQETVNKAQAIISAAEAAIAQAR